MTTSTLRSCFFNDPLRRASRQRHCLLFVLLLLFVLSFTTAQAQTYTATFSTQPTIDKYGYAADWPWNSTVTVNLGGVDYLITDAINGSFTWNGSAIYFETASDVSLHIKRKDGQAFKFYGVSLKYTNYQSPPYYVYPFLTLQYATTGSTQADELYDANKTLTVSKPAGVAVSGSGVTLKFSGLATLTLDDLIVGPAITTVAPTVATAAASSVMATNAVLGGNVTADGGDAVTTRGVVYSASNTTPTIADTKAVNGSGTGTFLATIGSLTAGTTYYVRAYATNSVGTSYGSVVSFVTSPNAPVLIVPSNGSIVSTTTPTYGGNNSPAGATIRIYVDGALLANTTTANSAGNWAITQPTALTQGSHTVYATAQTNGSAVSANSNTNTFTVDSVRPSVAISSPGNTSGGTTSSSPIPYTVTFSEAVTGFVAGDVTVAGGALSGFTGSGSTYSFNVTPSATGTVSVSIPANVAQDQIGNGNTAASQYSLTFAAPTIVVGPATLPNGQQGTAYSQTLSASGGTAPYTFAITVGALPAGLSLTSAGTLAGTPTADGTFNVTVTATDASATPGPYAGSRSYSLIIAPQPVTAAPVVIVPSNGSIVSTTTPTYGGTAPASATIRVYVDGALLANTTTANSAGNWAITQPTALTQGSHTVYATAQTNGSAVSANSNTNTFTVDSVRPSVAISSPGNTSGGTTSSSPIPYTVTFSEAVTGFVAGDVTVAGGALSGFTGSGSTYSFNVTPSAAGTVSVSIPANVAQDVAGNGNTAASQYSLTFQVPTIVVGPATLPNGQQGSAYNQTLSASGGTAPYTFAITVGALPAGLSLTSAGTLAGTPTADGTFNVTVTATDASATPGPYAGSRSYSLIIAPQPVTAAPVVIVPSNGSIVSTTTPTYGGNNSPAGATIRIYVDGALLANTTTANSAGNWAITQPTALTQGSHTVYATAQTNGSAVSANSNTNTFTVDSVRPSVAISSPGNTSGGTTSSSPIPYTVTFSEAVTGFVAGDVTVAGGALSGFTGSGSTYSFNVTPSATGTVSVSIPANVAQDQIGNGNTAASQYSLTFAAPTIVVGPATLPNGQQGSAYNQTLSASGGTAPYTFAITVGALPAGLSLTSAGTLAGTPTADGTFNVTVTATDASATPGPYAGSRSYSLIIAPQPVTAAPVVIVPSNGSIVSTTTPTYGGNNSPAGATIRIYVDGALLANTTTANSAGNWAITQPTALTQGSHTVYATAQTNGSAVSANSNTNTFTVDSVRPSVAISSPGNTNNGTTSSSPIPYTVSFSEAVTGFVTGDVTVTNGTVSGFSGSGSTYSFSVIPSANGTVSLSIPANVAQDQAGNGNTAATTYAIIYTQPVTVAPVVTAPAGGALVNSTTPTYTGTAEVNSTITVLIDGTSIGTTTATGAGNWSLAQPTALTQGSHTVRATAQLSGQAVSGNSNQNSFTVDTVAPTVVVASSAGANGSTTSTTPIPFTVTFSESVTGFVATDMSVSGGTITDFAGTGTTYTVVVTPVADGLITVNVSVNVAQDGANNGNTAATAFSLIYSRPITATPVVVTPANGSLITVAKPAYTGTATALASLTLVIDDNTASALTTTVDASGNWTITPLTDLAPGAHTVQARAQLTGQTASAYSAVSSFTLVVAATVATATPTGVNSNSATLGGNVTDAGAGTVSERGVVYVAGNGTPTTSDTKIIIGIGTGSFAQAVTGLASATTYSVRAYAINQAGTSYGSTQSFITVAGLNAVATATNVTCNGGANGSAQVTPSGGVAPYTYAWSPGNPAGQGTSQVSGLTAGSYSVLITDASGATLTQSVTVGQPSPVVVSIVPASTAVCGGSVVLTASTDAVNPRFAWTGTQPTTGAQVSVTSSGTYSVTVTSGSGCTATASSVVTINSLAVAPVTTPVAVCQNAPPVSLATGVTASGGGTLRWYTDGTGGSGSANAPVPPTNTVGQTIYYVSQVSSAGCESPRVALPFTVNALPVVTLSNDGPLSCAKPSATLTAGGAAGGGSTYRFSPGATQAGSTNLATVSTSGVYSVTVTDGNGCSATAETTVGSDQSSPQASLSNDGPLTCTKPTVTLTAGGTGTYRFSAGATQTGTSNIATVTTTGIYSVTVTAANGCSATAQTTVEVNTTVVAPTLTASALSTENAPISVTASGCSGIVNWTATGGTGTANGSVYTFTQPGNYTLTASCTVGSCTSPAAPSLPLQIRPGDFAIKGVQLVRCQLVDAGRGQYEISFTPQYSGLSGSPLSFGVTNELAATTVPGPYTLRLYTDNATLSLTATQGSAQAAYRFNWLAACSGTQPTLNRPPVAQPIPDQVLVVGQPYQLDLAGYFADPDGQSLTFTATNLPAGLQLSGSRISGSPTQAGSSTVQLTALDPGGLQAVGSVLLRIDPAPVTPTPGVFSIAGVTGVRCETLSVGERQLSFSPVYTGLTGESVSFGITNELATTTAPGPYTLRLYTDNVAITLTAIQGSAQATYRFSWLAACPTGSITPPVGNRPPVVGTGLGNQTAQEGQGYTLFIPAGTFTDPDNDPLQLSVSGLPAGLSFSAAQNAITGIPAQAGSSTIQVAATDPGGLTTSTSFVLTVQAAGGTVPAGFGITQVNTVNCEVLSAGERRVSFTPVYSGVSGSPISFSVVNELSLTTAPGPYTLRLYTDNPVITLVAQQGGSLISYRYDWLTGCTPNGRQGITEVMKPLQVTVLGNPVIGESAEVEIQGAEGQTVQVQLVDLTGYSIHQQQIRQADRVERLSLPIGNRQGVLLLKVSTTNQQQQIKLLRP